MKEKRLLNALGQVNDKYIEEAAYLRTKKSVWVKWSVMAACLCLATAVIFIIPNALFEPTPGQQTDAGQGDFLDGNPNGYGISPGGQTVPEVFEQAPGGKEGTQQAVAADLAPMVFVNDILYIQSHDQQGYSEMKDEFVYLGKIESTVSEERAPKENFQANDPIVGCEVYQYNENIVVKINGSYWLYVEDGEQ